MYIFLVSHLLIQFNVDNVLFHVHSAPRATLILMFTLSPICMFLVIFSSFCVAHYSLSFNCGMESVNNLFNCLLSIRCVV